MNSDLPPLSDDSEPEIPQLPSLIEQITMECMMNKKHYKKYLAKTDISRFQEIQEKMDHLEQARDEITEMTEELFNDIIKCCGESSKYNTRIQSTFDAYINACLDYINTTASSDREDDDMLFPLPASSYINRADPKINHSYWGKTIRKMK